MKKGQTLVEMMVGLGIAAAIMPAIITSFFAARGGTAQEAVRMQASARLRETREVLRTLKEGDWSTVSTDGTYHLSRSGSSWTLNQGPETGLDTLFNRQIIIGPAFRTLTNELTPVGGGSNILDPSVKHITITLSWTNPMPSSLLFDYYLMRIESLSYIETLLSDFDNEFVTHRSTIPTNVSGGEIQLGGSGSGVGDWCQPSLVLSSLDITRQGNPQGLTAIEGHAYATTGDNSSGPLLDSIDISNPPAPANPTAVEGGFFDGDAQPKGYALFATDDYVYIANNKRVVEIISTQSVTSVGYFNVSGGGTPTGRGIYVSDGVGYVIVTSSNTSPTLYAFSLTGSINPAPQLASITVAGAGKIFVVGDYAYVITNNTTQQLQIFDISNVASGTITPVSTLNLGNNQGGVDLYVSALENYAYLVTSYASPNFFVVDIGNKSNPTVIGSYTTTSNMNPKGLTVIPQDNVAIIVGSGTDLYQVLRINIPSSPTRCSPPVTFPGVTSINAISSVTEDDTDAYSYVLTNNASSEFQMIKGGPGGGGAGNAFTGVFDSQPFEPAGTATFNRFEVNTTLPSGTYAAYQIAVANKVGGSCLGASYTYVGPNKDTTQWFSGSSSIPLGSNSSYNNPGECFRYRVSLSTDNLGTSPVFNDITVNYSL